ncbi:AEC family transporter [Phycicoccus flavus]|uniref:AEC family transporter n=1 Tax=Phycicoccus flavus TaxID=2502783 RepID=UPI000FEB8A09|nr:AEC family transporter [Phycicoccus flavus]NHA68627.1 AEC family transporter [Phycicoccus flavus]
MGGVVLGFTTVAVVIAVGALVAHVGVLGAEGQTVLARAAFYLGSPALLLTTVAEADVRTVISGGLLATTSGVLVCAAVYLLVARWRWRRRGAELAVGALCASYVNAGNLGLPIAAYVLGDAAFVAPTLLLQLLVLQPVAVAVLQGGESGRGSGPGRSVARALANPLTIGTLAGLGLSLSGTRLPDEVGAPVGLVADLAVPAMLLSYGMALRLGARLGPRPPTAELAVVVVLKVLVQPVVVWLVAAGPLGLDELTALAVTVCSALPTAQNVFVLAVRYGRQVGLARDGVLVSTVASTVAVAAVVLVLG